mgnify:CR=1 FL=1
MTKSATLGDAVATNTRRREAGLLALVGAVIASLYVLASIGAKGHLPARLWLFLGVMFGLMYAMHRIIRHYAPNSSELLLPLAALLNGIGFIEISRWNPVRAQYQAAWTLISVLGVWAVLKFVRQIRDLDRYRYLTLVSAIALLMMPLIPHVGLSSSLTGGARLWVGFGPITFQPVEISKILLALFFASYFASNKEMLAMPTRSLGGRFIIDPRILLPVLAAWGMAIAVLGLENDLGFAMLLFALFLSLLWVTTGRLSYVVGGMGLIAGGGFIAAQFFYQVHQRVGVWLNPWGHWYDHGGYQILGGWFSLASGGLTGTGVGLGVSGRWVSEITSDMIFAAIGEELGLIGIIFVLSALLLIVAQGFKIAQRTHSDFSRLAAISLSVILAFQAFFISAGILRLLPLTGITFPFVAYGGSSLVANYVMLALLLKISNENALSTSGGRVRSDLFV